MSLVPSWHLEVAIPNYINTGRASKRKNPGKYTWKWLNLPRIYDVACEAPASRAKFSAFYIFSTTLKQVGHLKEKVQVNIPEMG